MSSPDKEVEKLVTSASGAKTSGNLPYYECLTETFIDRCALRMTIGAEKYGKYNWKKGARDREYILERLRHATKHLGLLIRQISEDGPFYFDDDAAAVCVNVMMAMEYQQNADSDQVEKAQGAPESNRARIEYQ